MIVLILYSTRFLLILMEKEKGLKGLVGFNPLFYEVPTYTIRKGGNAGVERKF